MCTFLKLPQYFFLISVTYKKVTQSHYRPGQAQRFPGGCGSQISGQSAYEGDKVVSPSHRPPLHPGNILAFISVRG